MEISKTDLASYWAEKLGWYYIEDGDYGKRYIHPPDSFVPVLKIDNPSGCVNANENLAYVLFESEVMAPIIAHLIQEYMEGEGYVWSLKKGNGYTADYELRENIKDAWKHHAVVNNENKWMANALAAWRALKVKEVE